MESSNLADQKDIYSTYLKGGKNPKKPQRNLEEPSDKPRRNYKFPRRLFLGSILLGSLAVVAFIIFAGSDLPPLSEIENPRSDLSTQIISADGVLLGSFFSNENRVKVQLKDISPHVIDGLIATEDKRFYKHSGVDRSGLPAFIYRNVLLGKRSGVSTISMQLARNLYDEVGKKRTMVRKIKEAIVSARIERKFTKEEILVAYLNTVNIYGIAFGIETASQKMFGKPAKDLDLAESALIVGLLKGQGYYDPKKHPERALNRRNTVINLMVDQNLIKSDSAAVAKKKPIVLVESGFAHTRGNAPYFREHVRKYLKEWCKKNGYNLYKDGLKIYTTIDSRMQDHAENAVEEHLSSLQKTFDKEIKGREPYRYDKAIMKSLIERSNRYQNAKKKGKTKKQIDRDFNAPREMTIYNWEGEETKTMTPLDSIKHYAKFLETGFMSMDPRSGHIKAWVGGINYKYFKYEHVAQGRRQVGSTFKPFVYATAIDNGMSPCDYELNQPVYFDLPTGDRWEPKNADGEYGGKMTLRSGLASSVNMITAKLMKRFGPPAVAQMAYDMGIRTKLDEVPALCLGTTDLSVFELTGAYCTFANEGVWTEPTFITRIQDKNGKTLKEFIPETNKALSPEKAYQMVELLRGVVDEPGGTARRLRFRYSFSNQIAGKTGTTQNHSDGWFMGVTPNLVSGVWVGCAERAMRFKKLKYGQGANMALPIWALYMKKVYDDPKIGLKPENFEPPVGFTQDLYCKPENADTIGGVITLPPKPKEKEPKLDPFSL